MVRRLLATVRRDEAGISLIEMFAALLVLAVALTALARTMIVSLQTVTQNERRTVATALQTEVIETLQTMPWGDAVLYEDDLADVAGDVDTSVSPALFEGHDLALLPGPGDGSDCGDTGASLRDPKIPCPLRTVDRAGVEYTVKTFITWVDRDGDGVAETKHLTAVVSWDDHGAGVRTSRLEADRASTETLDLASGIRLLQFSVAPDPEDLVDDGDGDVESGEGRLTHDLKVVARFSNKMQDATVKYHRVAPGDEDADDEEYVDDASLVEQTLVLTKVQPDPSGHTAVFTGTIPKGLGYYFAHGDNVFSLTATKGSEVVAGADNVLFTGGPFSLTATSSSGSTSGPPAPTITAAPSPDPGTDTDVSWSFDGDATEGDFQCRVYFQVNTPPSYSTCTSPFTTTLGEGDGTYVFEVYQEALADGEAGEVAEATYALETNPPSSTDVAITSWVLSPNPICVDNSDELTQDLVLDIVVQGLAPTDPVQATYSYWSESNKSASPDATASQAAVHVSGTADSGATFRVTVDKDVTHNFKKNRSTAFTFTAGPRSDGQNDETTPAAYTISKKSQDGC